MCRLDSAYREGHEKKGLIKKSYANICTSKASFQLGVMVLISF